MPVAVSEVDGQVDVVLGQLAFESGNQRPILGVDRTDTAKMGVMFGDFFQPFSRNVAAASDVFQKWHDVVHAFGAAERQHEERIVGARRIVKKRCA